MANKIGDAKVKIGTYTDRNGQTKNRWLDLGPAYSSDSGGFNILANPCINLAGLPKAEGKDYVTIYVFPPNNNGGYNGGGGGYQRGNQNTNLYRDNGGSQGNQNQDNAPLPFEDVPF